MVTSRAVVSCSPLSGLAELTLIFAGGADHSGMMKIALRNTTRQVAHKIFLKVSFDIVLYPRL